MSESESEIPDFHFDYKANANVVYTPESDIETKFIDKSKLKIISGTRKRDGKW